jgi:hypothetical protein
VAAGAEGLVTADRRAPAPREPPLERIASALERLVALEELRESRRALRRLRALARRLDEPGARPPLRVVQ